jgi:hypothetical protein
VGKGPLIVVKNAVLIEKWTVYGEDDNFVTIFGIKCFI